MAASGSFTSRAGGVALSTDVIATRVTPASPAHETLASVVAPTFQPVVARRRSELDKRVVHALLTPAGEQIMALTGKLLRQVENIRVTAREFTAPDSGTLALATTHTQSRYVLPPVITRFIARYPGVALHMHQGTPLQIAELAATGTADLAIATEAMESFANLSMVPCYRWNRVVLVPPDHALAALSRLTLAQLARYPLVTYVFGFTGRSRLDDAFQEQGLNPQVVFTAADADVIKTYVRLGIGVGIVASMAYDSEKDSDLVALDASHLFDFSITKIGFLRGALLRSYIVDFISMFAPHLSPEMIARVQAADSQAEVDALFADTDIPTA